MKKTALFLLILGLFCFIFNSQAQDKVPVAEQQTSTAQGEKTMQVDAEKTLKRSVFSRILGKCATKLPENDECWTFENNQLIIDLSVAKELENIGGALRCEGKEMPVRVLVLRGDDNELYAVQNSCSHGKRRLDPVPGAGTVQCCSMGKSTYSYEGKHLNGDLDNLTIYSVDVSDGKAFISVQ